MSFPFVLRRTYEDLQGDYECMQWAYEKQIEQCMKEREGLILRISAGEEYRESMEKRLEDLLDDNRRLYEGRASARDQLAAAERKIKELTLLKDSMESRWVQKEE